MAFRITNCLRETNSEVGNSNKCIKLLSIWGVMCILVPTKYLCRPIHSMDVTAEMPSEPTLHPLMYQAELSQRSIHN
jgi:hypothetical protein